MLQSCSRGEYSREELAWRSGLILIWRVCNSLFVAFLFFFFNDTATTEIYTLSLHDALPISFEAIADLLAAAGAETATTAIHKQPVSIGGEPFWQIGRAHV